MADSADTLLAQMGDILAHTREVKGVLAASPAFAVYLSGMINALHQGGGGTAESTTATSVQITTPFTVPPPGLEHTPTTVAAALMDTPTFDCQGVSSWAGMGNIAG